MALKVELVHLYPLENAKQHHTDKFEVVHNKPATPVVRRGQAFFAALRFKERVYNDFTDVVSLVFNYSKSKYVNLISHA